MPSGKVKTLSRFNNVQLNDLAWLPDCARPDRHLSTERDTLMRAVKLRLYLNPPASFAPLLGTPTTIRRLLFRRTAERLPRSSKEPHKRSTCCLPPDSPGNPPNPAPAQIKDAIFFDWAGNGTLYFDDVDSLVRISADGGDKSTL